MTSETFSWAFSNDALILLFFLFSLFLSSLLSLSLSFPSCLTPTFLKLTLVPWQPPTSCRQCDIDINLSALDHHLLKFLFGCKFLLACKFPPQSNQLQLGNFLARNFSCFCKFSHFLLHFFLLGASTLLHMLLESAWDHLGNLNCSAGHCPDHFENNCAHYLADTLILGGFLALKI